MQASIDSSIISKFKLFETLSQEEQRTILDNSVFLKITKGDYLYRKGDLSKFVYLLIDGGVKEGNVSKSGRELIKFVHHPFSVIGLMSLAGEIYREGYATSLNRNTSLLRVEVQHITQIFKTNTAFSLGLLKELGKNLRISEKRLESLMFLDARSRIVDFIKYNANLTGLQVGLETLLKHNFTQQDIANFTGTSRQTVVAVLNDLKRSNQIYFKRNSMLIRDMASLS